MRFVFYLSVKHQHTTPAALRVSGRVTNLIYGEEASKAGAASPSKVKYVLHFGAPAEAGRRRIDGATLLGGKRSKPR